MFDMTLFSFPYLALLVLGWMNGSPANPVPVQQADETAVKTSIRQLFEGMRRGDSSAVKEVFAPDAILQTIQTLPDGTVRVKTGSLPEFLQAVGSPHPEVWDERIEFGPVMIDHELASVWTPYRFYLGSRFSHCGVNSFQLVRLDGRWKIVHLIDTRRKEGQCP